LTPSTEWQNVSDWAVVPKGGEYSLDQQTNRTKARWHPPVLGPETVIDKGTDKPQAIP
jgi:hypothetical protein